MPTEVELAEFFEGATETQYQLERNVFLVCALETSIINHDQPMHEMVKKMLAVGAELEVGLDAIKSNLNLSDDDWRLRRFEVKWRFLDVEEEMDQGVGSNVVTPTLVWNCTLTPSGDPPAVDEE